MDIGSGLIVQTRTVNGKSSAGIFLNSENLGRSYKDKTRSKYGRYPIRGRTGVTVNSRNGNNRSRNTATLKKDDLKTQETKPASTTNTRPKDARVSSGEKQPVKDTNENNKEQPDTTNKPQTKKMTGKPKPEVRPGNRKTKAGSKGQEVNEVPEVNTKYVTLTQGQLNTILSLVKSKNDIDVTNVLENKEEDGKEETENIAKDENGEGNAEKQEEKKSGSRPGSGKSFGSGKENEDENIMNLLKNAGKDEEKGKNKNEKAKKNAEKGKTNSIKDEKDENRGNSRENSDLTNGANVSEKPDSSSGRQSQEGLPAAIRSSFFLGEAAPREHAFSARKREEQRRWREELDKQRVEQREKKVAERNARLKAEEDESWSKHFDTMLPTKLSPRHSEARNSLEFPPQGTAQQSTEVSTSQSQPVTNNTQTVSVPMNTAPMPSFGNPLSLGPNVVSNSKELSGSRDFGSGAQMNGATNSAPQRSTYLRTMTSLLDPAQIEALEVKRQKQEEHRRAIEAQVEERRRKKEEEENLRRQLEIEEDHRLAAEHDMLAQQTEIEKQRHQVQENMREQKTRELYQQMKDAQESALRDKLSKREQLLRNKGHDTSRLERAHQLTLETTRKFKERPLAQTSLASLATSSLTNFHLSTERFATESVSPRQVVTFGDGHAPMAVTAQTDKGPVQFEISLNQLKQGEMVESGVQTEERITEARRGNERVVDSHPSSRRITDAQRLRLHDGYESDDMTEYMQLPQRNRNNGEKKTRDKRGKNTRLQNFERDLDRQYDQHSRNVAGDQPQPKKDGKRPKWGVGQKNKNFVPASQRYTTGQQRREALLRKEREERHAIDDSLARNRIQERQRPKSPAVPAVRNKQKKEITRQANSNNNTNVRGTIKNRPSSGIHATTDRAKYRQEKHSRDSPVPETTDFVQYRRTTAVLDPSKVESRPETGPLDSRTEFVQRSDRPHPGAVGPGVEGGDPLLNPDIVRQHERQDQILREISILRQGLLIKQREVASYPAAMTHSMAVQPGMAPTSLVLAGGGNLPERTNDTPLI